jgi:hypothetical protein
MASTSNTTEPAGASGSDMTSNVSPANGPTGQSLQAVLEERDRLRKELTEARDEVMRLRCQAELLREEWFMARLQEEEYRKYIRKLTGSDPYIHLRDVREAEKNGLTMAQLLEEMERAATSNSSGQ